MSQNKKSFGNHYDKLTKNILNLQESHNLEINLLLDNHKKDINTILHNISKEFNIPIDKLLKYNKNDNIKLIDNTQVSSDNEKEISSVLVKETINNKSYYVDKEKGIIYKSFKNKKSKKVGTIDSNNNYVFN